MNFLKICINLIKLSEYTFFMHMLYTCLIIWNSLREIFWLHNKIIL